LTPFWPLLEHTFLIPIDRGELFSVAGIRVGFENIERAYRQQGYVDATPEPETEVDDDRRTIDLVIKIGQQVQYRLGSIEFWGVNAATREKLMESLPKSGEVFDATKLDEFFRVNRTILPPEASGDDVRVERDNKLKRVRILNDLRVCPQQAN